MVATKTKKTIIRWSEEEWQAVAASVFEQRIANPTSNDITSMVERAQQELLPKHRRRDPRSVLGGHSLATYTKSYAKHWLQDRRFDQAEREAFQGEIDRLTESVKDLKAECQRLRLEMLEGPEADEPTGVMVDELSTEDLMYVLLDRATSWIEQQRDEWLGERALLVERIRKAEELSERSERAVEELEEMVTRPRQAPMPPTRQLEEPVEPQEPAEPGEPTRSRRVLVVGLKPNQEQVVRRAFPSGVDLRFMASEKGQSLDPKCMPNAEFAVLARNFISHGNTDVAQKAYGRDRVTVVQGGVTKVIAEIKARLK